MDTGLRRPEMQQRLIRGLATDLASTEMRVSSDRRGALFLAEVVRRHKEIREKWPETPVRTIAWRPRRAWSVETRAYIEAWSTSERETKSAPPPQHAAAGSGEVRRTGTA